MKKKSLLILIVAALAFLVVEETIYSWTVGDLSNCVDKSSGRMETTSEMQKMGQWNKERICVELERDIKLLTLCVEEVQEKRHVPAFFISLLNKSAGLDIDKAIQQYETVCGQFPSIN